MSIYYDKSMKIPFLKKKWISQEQMMDRESLLKGFISPIDKKSKTQDSILYEQDDVDNPQEVVGESFRQKPFIKQFGKHTKEGYNETCEVVLYPEPENEKDRFAVKVLISAGHIGYLPKNNAKKIQELLIRTIHQTQKLVAVKGVVRGGWKQGLLGRDKANFGVTLQVELKELMAQMSETLADPEQHYKPQ